MCEKTVGGAACPKPGYIIAGNWKMNKGPADAAALAKEICSALGEPGCEVVVCPPYVSLSAVAEAICESGIALGAQNCHWESSGAFTGEVAPVMLKELGARYVIVGHSERRALFGDTNESVGLRLGAALSAGLRGILCVGETLDQRRDGSTEKVISAQLEAALKGVDAGKMRDVVIAYEPVWAIGTGQTATDEQAEETCAFVRRCVAGLFGEDTAAGLQVLYGGSMNAGNAKGLLSCPNINGGLIGGAALKAGDFATIVRAAGSGEAV